MSRNQEAFMEAIRKVSARAAVDPAFRSLCASDIHAAIRQESGIELPASFTIGVLDPSANMLNIVLPPMAGEEGELGEDELGRVAGGVKGTAAEGSGEMPRDSVGIIPGRPDTGGMIYFGGFPQ
ncbi:hypothetical protein GXP70_19550 [Paenibacillus lycopersici]|uniref:NHLP leader peptide family natural product n=1 Tax=Paenibacillus lycopersici TaxID=2704462 RepID=A0A6C0G3R6_9BACL|nr:hypothetical protein [Paenibacillus lycopersici]QHT61959.1 hypothetical protein GXP70_19550 [Paenibacillus lycopersici]